MSDVVSLAEIGGQQVELLPARTMMQATGGSDPTSGLLGSGGDPSGNGGSAPFSDLFGVIPFDPTSFLGGP